MSPVATIIATLGALLLGAMSPGPSLVIGRNGLASATGIGVGGVLFDCIALAGLYTLLTTPSWLNTNAVQLRSFLRYRTV
jgi:threonine/homoserine/homoserine lactone efflux protein